LADVAEIDPDRLVKMGRNLVARAMQQLDDIIKNADYLHNLITEIANEDEWSGQRRAAAHRAIEMNSLSAALRNLATAAKMPADKRRKVLKTFARV
jgi:hypothetical protein